MSGAALLRRLLWTAPTLVGVAIVVFVLLRVVPGDPIAMMIPPGATPDDIVRLRAQYGLDASIPVQFARWVAQLVHGDFGVSISLREPVTKLVASRLPATLELSAVAMALATVVGVGLAMAAVAWRRRWPETAIDSVAGLGLAIPDFLWGLVFILVFGVLWPVLPVSGRLDPRIEFDPHTRFFLTEALVTGRFDVVGELARHLVLPACALALPLAAALSRVVKASVLDVLNDDAVAFARTKGLPPRRILWRIALRNALIPAVTLTGVQFTFLVGGSVLIETIFAYPGIGSLALGAVVQRDLPLIQGVVLAFAVLFVALNLAIDGVCAALDPRARSAAT